MILEDSACGVISIHAPVKGATLYLLSYCYGIDISIHAPVKGATKFVPLANPIASYFNPRTREGCDQP